MDGGLSVAAPENVSAWQTVSITLGWISFVLWSISFYPQVYTNWKRKAVTGLSFDFELYNLLGFSCLALYNAMLFWNTRVRDEYADRYPDQTPKVAVNDVFFGIHAFTLTCVHLLQIAVYDRGNQKISYLAMTVVALALTGALVFGIVVATGNALLLDWLYYVSYVKLFLTFIKYCPQVYLNWARKSTVGWNIINILLDLTGGLLSLCQLLIDCWVVDDWSGITGNPVKFFLSLLSIFFDLVFMYQHYVLYRDRTDPDARKPALQVYTDGDDNDEDNEIAKLVPASGDSSSVQDVPRESALWRFLAAFTTQTSPHSL